MGDKTGISWADASWNPFAGCTPVSEGCRNCYAMELHERRHAAWKEGRWDDAPVQYHKPFREVQALGDERLKQPLRWKRPRRIFVNSMSDVFHKDVPEIEVAKVWGVMAAASWHRFIVLTKRPDRMLTFLEQYWPDPVPNVLVGVSAEDQDTLFARSLYLCRAPAAARGISLEPLLERVEIGLLGTLPKDHFPGYTLAHDLIDWIIVGGESGPNARPFHEEWAEAIVEECSQTQTAVHVKQMGSNPYRRGEPVKLGNGKGASMGEWPPALRVRQYPERGGER